MNDLAFGCVLKTEEFKKTYCLSKKEISKITGISSDSVSDILYGKSVNFNEFAGFMDGFGLEKADAGSIFGFYYTLVPSEKPTLDGEYLIQKGVPKQNLAYEIWMQGVKRKDIEVLCCLEKPSHLWSCKKPIDSNLRVAIAHYLDCEVKDIFY